MWKTLQHPTPGDFVGATGESHSVKEFVQEAFQAAGIQDWEAHVNVDAKFNRPAEVHNLRGDPSKAHRELGWTPKVRFHELVKIMVAADLERLRTSSG